MSNEYINDYGRHPTIYSNLSDIELYGMYRSNTWRGLDSFERLELMQETVNRAAVEKGEIGSCEAHYAALAPQIRADQFADKIRFDVYKFAGNDPSIDDKGNLREISPLQNVEALEAALHENEHAWQNQAMEEIIPTDDKYQIFEYKANNFTISQLENGNLGHHYLGESVLYYLQSTERDAHINSQAKTLEILEMVENAYGKEESFDTYRQVMEFEGYKAQLEEAQRVYKNPAVERDVNQVLINHYYGVNLPVDPKVKTDVEALMEKGLYERLHNQNQVEPNQLNNDIKNNPINNESLNSSHENTSSQKDIIDFTYNPNNTEIKNEENQINSLDNQAVQDNLLNHNQQEHQNNPIDLDQQEENQAILNQGSTIINSTFNSLDDIIDNSNDNTTIDLSYDFNNNGNFNEENNQVEDIEAFTNNSNQTDIDNNFSIINDSDNSNQDESTNNSEDNDNSQTVSDGIDFF